MSRLPKFSVPVAGLAVLALLLTLFAGEVKSSAAALVQIVSTAANPAITQSTHTLASQIVTLGSLDPVTGANALFQISPTGTRMPSPYTVPAGTSLVIESVEALLFCCSNAVAGQELLITINSNVVAVAGITPGANFFVDQWHPGIVAGPGTTLGVFYGGVTNPGIYDLFIHGYLTAN
jgi:hypothetical protein